MRVESVAMSRRTVLSGLVATGAATLLRADAPPRPPQPRHIPNRLQAFPKKTITKVTPPSYPNMSMEMAKVTLRNLQYTEGSNQERRRAVETSLRMIAISGRLAATAMQIDTSGLYLTARHTVAEIEGMATSYNPDIYIVDPHTGIANPARAVYLSHTADIGVIYAPTGREQNSVPNLALSYESLKNNERLELNGTRPSQFAHFVDTGRVDTTLYSAPNVGVRDMIPYGGTSGSPIIDQDNRVRGILSGPYVKGVNAIENYLGARIVPVSEVEGLSTVIDLP